MPEKISTKEGRVYTPTRSYDLQLIIKDLDYTGDLIGVNLHSSLATGYQIVDLILAVDPNDIITERLYGEDPITLRVTSLLESQPQVPGERIDFKLMYLKSDFQMGEKEEMSTKKTKDRSILVISTVTRDPYNTLSKVVNEVYIGYTLRQMINDLVSNTNAEVYYDSDGENVTPISQVCIPPTTLYKIIKEYDRKSPDMFDGFLDQRFGLFDGTPGVFCQYDNKIYIKNLTYKMLKDQSFTIYQLASNTEEKILKQIFADVRNPEKRVFYTFDLVDTDYSGNARFATIASSIRHIVKPSNSLSETVFQDLRTVGKNYSLIYKNPNIPVDSNVDRIKFYNEDTGNEYDNTLFNSRFGRRLADLSAISVNIERNLPILPLMNIGECVKYKPLTLEYQDLEGKYILWSTSISFMRAAEWKTTCRVNLIRTNRTK